ncbi:MAG: hypothetical protein RLZZ507_4383 [Cyanobacteriota bacterium]|jgi:hypothetical protein
MTGTLFNLDEFTSLPSRARDVDPYWDEIVLDCSGKVEENGQSTLFYDSSEEPPDPNDYPDQESYGRSWTDWEQLHPDVNVRAMSVLEDEEIRVSALPEQEKQDYPKKPYPLPEQRKTQWVEEYYVTRNGTRHWYYRYCYYDKRIHHVHIPGGNHENAIALERKLMIEKAIALGISPHKIENFIRGGFGINGNKLVYQLLPPDS